MDEITCIGGDQRMYYAVNSLSENDCKCRTYHVPGYEDEIKKIPRGSIVVLPYPSVKSDQIVGLSKNEQTELALLSSGNILIGGSFSASFLQALPQDIQVIDVSTSEPFLMNNARLSAECALGKAIVTYPGALRGSKVLVMGYGRIGAELSRLLLACGAEVCVFARNPENKPHPPYLNMCDLASHHCEGAFSEFQCIFNTIPKPIIDLQIIRSLREDCYFYELASAPGGLFEGAELPLKERYLKLPGLPGKYAPAQAGKFYAQEILRRLEEIKCTNRQPSVLP